MAASHAEPKTVANFVFAAGLFFLGIYMGLTMMIADARFQGHPSWTYVWVDSTSQWIWGLPPLITGLIGLISMVMRKYTVTVFMSGFASLWAFIIGFFLLVAVAQSETANPWWPPLMWFVSLSYTLVAMTLIDKRYDEQTSKTLAE